MRPTIKIKCFDSCVYTLVWPEFFLEAPLGNTKKVIDYMLRYSWKNEETIDFLHVHMPSLQALATECVDKALEKNRMEETLELNRCYCDKEARKEVKAYHASKARRIRKYPETAQKVMEFWQSRVNKQ